MSGRFDNLELMRTASALMREHGEYASTFAAVRADAGLDRGSMEDFHHWYRILMAIKAVQEIELKAEEMIH